MVFNKFLLSAPNTIKSKEELNLLATALNENPLSVDGEIPETMKMFFIKKLSAGYLSHSRSIGYVCVWEH